MNCVGCGMSVKDVDGTVNFFLYCTVKGHCLVKEGLLCLDSKMMSIGL